VTLLDFGTSSNMVVLGMKKEVLPPHHHHMDNCADDISEYEAKYVPFTDYAYFTNTGFKKVQRLNASEASNGKAQKWYIAVEEIREDADKNKYRSENGHPMVGSNLENIYAEDSFWDNNYHNWDRNGLEEAIASAKSARRMSQ